MSEEKNGVIVDVLKHEDNSLKKVNYNVNKKERASLYLFLKRSVDIIGSFFGLLILSPMFLVVSLLIFLEDHHSPFFKQVRLTKNGKSFIMYKFRSMCVEAESMLPNLQHANEVDGPAFKIKNDPRITKVGRFLRKTSIDELPQLINVLMGDMSIVGPRPPLPNEVEQYNEYQMQRLSVKSGLTCYWQCSGRNELSFDKWVELDLKYINEMSILTDIKIILMTVVSVFKRNGAY